MTGNMQKPDRSRLLPELRKMLEELDGEPAVDYASLDPVVEREGSETRLAELWGPPEPVDTIEELTFPSGGSDIPVRIYRPEGAKGTILFLHGGGWVLGSRNTHDGSCRMLANAARCNLVSVEYRKAPEHKFPAAIEDCDAALDWLLKQGPGLGLDTAQIVICGESAGGNLAAVLAIHARDRGIPLAGQVLVYPVIDTSMSRQSYRDFASGFYLAAAAMDWFITHYAEPARRAHPDLVPLNAADLSGLAPALVMTADHDPLRDEGRAYAAALVAAGNEVSFREIAGVVHGIWVMNAKTPACREIIELSARWIRERLG